MVWIVTRAAFWVGYHYGSHYRALGAPGMMQSILVLLYVCGHFGYGYRGDLRRDHIARSVCLN
ncbi:MAG: hypothetical protein ACLP4V_28025 [Methylocella sp.]